MRSPTRGVRATKTADAGGWTLDDRDEDDVMRRLDPAPTPILLRKRAESNADAVAMLHVDGAELSYGEFHDANVRWAGAYQAQGLVPGDRVMTLIPNTFEAFHAWLGAAWGRIVEVSLNTSWRGAWLEHALAVVQPRMIVATSKFAELFRDVPAALACVDSVVIVDADGDVLELPCRVITVKEFLDEAIDPALHPLADHDVAAGVFTSGTTGRSKCARVHWAPLTVEKTLFFGDENDGITWYSPFPPFHGTGKGYVGALAAAPDGQMILRDQFSTDSFWSDIRKFGCTHTALMGAMTYFLALRPASPDDADNPLRGVVMAPLIPQLDEFKRRFGIDVCTTYGQTETNLVFGSGWETSSANWRTCGRLPKGFTARIVDEFDSEVAIGDTGELILRHDRPWILTSGYLGMPDATGSAWRNGWWHTGDSFRRDEEGNYYFVDRTKDAIRRRGENISSFEVEAVIAQHPAVAEVAVVAVNSEFSEDEVKACLVLRPDVDLDPVELIDFLAPKMPRFAIPRYIEVLPELPKTPNLRVQKASLRERGVTEATWDRDAHGITIPT